MKDLVLVNGVFDVLHLGHVKSLKKASKYGDLIVAINSDASVKRLKGYNRPINNQKDRKEFLSYFDFIEKVVVFNENDVCNLLRLLKPKIWVKSGYTLETIKREEWAVAKELGIKIKLLPKYKDLSTSKILEKYE